MDVRHITEDEIPEWSRALDTGFLRPTSEAHTEWRQAMVDPARTIGAFDGSRCVGTFRSSPKVVTVPGGAELTASGVTNVSVTATHRRRGLLSRMMAQELSASVDRGEPLAILIAAEYPIYGRYGFGPATSIAGYRVDVPRAALGPTPPAQHGRIDLVDGAEVRRFAPEMHDRFRRGRPGALARDDLWWTLLTGERRDPSDEWKEPFFALYRDASGRVDGLLTYQTDDHWDGMLPKVNLTVGDLIATTPAAEAALWHLALSVDWVSTVTAEQRPPDDLLPLLLGDPRAAAITTLADFMWLRLLDTARALAARTYSASGRLVLDVRDPAGFAGGRFLLEGGPDGATCVPTTEAADLALDVGALGALYLGDESAARSAAVGRLDEERPGALARMDVMFRSGRRPWCPDIF